MVQLHVTTYGKQGASVRFVLQEEPPAPPLIAAIRFDHASPGDRVQLGGYRFASTAADNRVEVCGTTTRADRHTEIPPIAGYAALEFAVPAVAGICDLRLRHDSDGTDWSGAVTLTVEAPTAVTLALGPFGAGALDPPRGSTAAAATRRCGASATRGCSPAAGSRGCATAPVPSAARRAPST